VRATPVWGACEKDENLRKELERETKKNGDYDGHNFSFPEGKVPYTRILAYHDAVCFQNALERGWIQLEEAENHIVRHIFSKGRQSAFLPEAS